MAIPDDIHSGLFWSVDETDRASCSMNKRSPGHRSSVARASCSLSAPKMGSGLLLPPPVPVGGLLAEVSSVGESVISEPAPSEVAPSVRPMG